MMRRLFARGAWSLEAVTVRLLGVYCALLFGACNLSISHIFLALQTAS